MKTQKIEEAIEKVIGSLDLKGITQEEMFGKEGIIKTLTAKLINKVLEAEMGNYLGYEKNSSQGDNSGNSRNGYLDKKIITGENDKLEIKVPRDRQSKFEPIIVPKRSKRLPIFNDQIISMYAFGMSQRDIQAHLKEIYGVEVSAELISKITDTVIEEVRQWQQRPLDKLYTIVYLDALRVNSREEGVVEKKAVYIALGINIEGKKEVLGLWIADNEGARFWTGILNELKNRGIEDILIACIDGLSGFQEAINTVYPNTHIQRCIVHMIRNSTKYVSYKDIKQVCQDLKEIYSAPNEKAGIENLEIFANKWDRKYPFISRAWKNTWNELNEFFKYPPEIRKIIYTTNAIESLNFQLRKVTKAKLSFPNDNAIIKIMYLALKNASCKWTMPIRNWGMALNQFAIVFGDRVPL